MTYIAQSLTQMSESHDADERHKFNRVCCHNTAASVTSDALFLLDLARLPLAAGSEMSTVEAIDMISTACHYSAAAEIVALNLLHQAERAGCVGIEALDAARAALATCGKVA